MSDILDLGTFDAPVWVFGGVYGNLQALDALLARASEAGVGPDRMICTGDVVAYCADPEAVSQQIMTLAIPTVMGNCEESLAAEADDCGCGFSEGSECDTLSKHWFDYCQRALSDASKTWMAGLPRRIDFTLGDKRFAVIHGAPSEINRFIFRSTPAEMKAAQINSTGADAVIGGHSGLPFVHDLGRRLWLNAGAIGMPANDGTRRVWYATLSPGSSGIEITLTDLDYDHQSAQAAIQAAELPDGYRACLDTGLWPNVEILPVTEANQTGQAIQPKTVIWN